MGGDVCFPVFQEMSKSAILVALLALETKQLVQRVV